MRKFALFACLVACAAVTAQPPGATFDVAPPPAEKRAEKVFCCGFVDDDPKKDEKKDDRKVAGYSLGLKQPKDLDKRIKLSQKRHIRALASLPLATEPDFDLRAAKLVPPIKNQGNCGSCWCFAGVGAAEGAWLKAGKGTPENTNWSEQCVLDCGRNGGCDGDWPESALEFIKNSGVANTSDYPYRASTGRCRGEVDHSNVIDDYGYVGASSGVPGTQDIKDAMKAYGMIAVAVAVDDQFAGYNGGVFKDTGYRGINHAVLLVGWHDDRSVPGGGYWILRNSWGENWGEKGYMRIAYGANAVGYGAMYAVVHGSPVPPVPPVPPGPNPPSPGVGYTGTIAKVTTYKDGVEVGSIVVVGGGPGGNAVEAELKEAGISPQTIVAVLQLLSDLKAKKGMAVIFADLLAIVATLSDAPAAPEKKTGWFGRVAEFALAA